jgi:transcriptional regulator with XRE-family HTH domain
VKPAQVRMARAALNWSLAELAKASGVHRNTISNFETGRYGGEPDKLAAVRAALEAAGVDFVSENGGGAGVRLRKAPVANQSDASLNEQIALQKAAIAEIPEHSKPSPEAGMAAMDKALAENDLVKMKNERTRRKSAKRK